MAQYGDRPRFLLDEMDRLLRTKERRRDLQKAAKIPGFTLNGQLADAAPRPAPAQPVRRPPRRAVPGRSR
jgi:hypothetical protein